MTKQQKEDIKQIANHYGLRSQEDVAIEECSELIKAILKRRRRIGEVADIIDELADVEIMCKQLECLYGCEAKVEAKIDFKIARQRARMETGE